MEWQLEPKQCIDLGGPLGRLTWHTLEMICEVLRREGKVEIHCGFQPYVADLVVDICHANKEGAA